MGFSYRRRRSRGRSGPERFQGYHANYRHRGFDRDSTDPRAANRENPYGARPSNRGGRQQRSWSHGDVETVRKLGLPIRPDATSGSNAWTWFKVTIPSANEMGKNFIIDNLSRAIEVEFAPYCFAISSDGRATFYVQGADQASALQVMNKRITFQEGFKMIILLRQSESPPLKIDEAAVALMEAAVRRRWCPASLQLNLSNFAGDDVLKAEGIYMSLCRPNVFQRMLSIIEEKIPQVEILDLSDNRLAKLDLLGEVELHSLKRLNLAGNQVKNESELEAIRSLKLVEINLEKNPVCNQWKDREKYISAVRKRFPKLKVLDSNELPAPIGTAIDEEETVLPARQPGSVQDESVNRVLSSFVAEFFQYFDSHDRQPLLNAYHDNAIFTYSYFANTEKQSKQGKFDKYAADCRNLVKTSDEGKRLRAVKMGRLGAVSSFTSSFPQTVHDLGSLAVDSHVATAALLVFTVNGVFKELEHDEKNVPTRAFYRTFVLIPDGPSGFKIVNDQLTLTNASGSAVSNAFVNNNSLPMMTTVQPSLPSDEIKSQMVVQFSQQSDMNERFSKECLEVNNWNYERAGQVFIDLKSQGKIPPEAFVKSGF